MLLKNSPFCFVLVAHIRYLLCNGKSHAPVVCLGYISTCWCDNKWNGVITVPSCICSSLYTTEQHFPSSTQLNNISSTSHTWTSKKFKAHAYVPMPCHWSYPDGSGQSIVSKNVGDYRVLVGICLEYLARGFQIIVYYKSDHEFESSRIQLNVSTEVDKVSFQYPFSQVTFDFCMNVFILYLSLVFFCFCLFVGL